MRWRHLDLMREPKKDSSTQGLRLGTWGLSIASNCSSSRTPQAPRRSDQPLAPLEKSRWQE